YKRDLSISHLVMARHNMWPSILTHLTADKGFFPSIKQPVLRAPHRGGGYLVHCGSSPPACSATMYAAYQSGQFASRCPVRFSCCPWAASARRSALARLLADSKVVVAGSMRPGSRIVPSCNSQPLPSG